MNALERIVKEIEALEEQMPKYKRPTGEFAYLVIEDLRPEMFECQHTEQLSFVPSITDLIYADMPKWLKEYKRSGARIKHIAKQYNISLSKAQKFYEDALERFVRKLTYEHYMANKDYYHWIYSPDGVRCIRRWLELHDQLYNERINEFNKKIVEGREHVVEIEVNDPELERVLDDPSFAHISYHGPFSFLLQNPGLTEHDAKILWVNKYIKIVKGNPETILKYEFPPKQSENTNKFRCIICGAELDYNDIGINKKLGAKTEDYFKCPKCIGLKKEEVDSLVYYYRSSGCNMFI